MNYEYVGYCKSEPKPLWQDTFKAKLKKIGANMAFYWGLPWLIWVFLYQVPKFVFSLSHNALSFSFISSYALSLLVVISVGRSLKGLKMDIKTQQEKNNDIS